MWRVQSDDGFRNQNIKFYLALKHRQFRSLVEKFHVELSDLTMHAEVKWSSQIAASCAHVFGRKG